MPPILPWPLDDSSGCEVPLGSEAVWRDVSNPTDAVTTPTAAPPPVRAGTEDDAARLFSLSIVISGTRCLLTYIVFPWVLPLLGIAGGVGPVVGVTVGVVAIAFNILSIRRWRSSTHAWRVPLMTLNSLVVAFLVVLVALDVSELLS
jgi:multisubunit Na+/H+ antiporter MnhB subunit